MHADSTGTTGTAESADTVLTPPRAQSPGPQAWLRMIQAEAKMVIRDTAGLIIPLGLPLLIMVMQAGSVSGVPVTAGLTALDVFVIPLIITMVIATVAVINMPTLLASYRKTKVLRRLAVTPASPAMVLVAQMVVSLGQVLVGIVLSLTVAALFFDASPPRNPLTAVLVGLAICAAMYAVGMIVAALAPTTNAALALGLVAFFALAALGGMFGPVAELPWVLSDIGAWLPFAAGVEALQQAWLGETVPWESWVSLGATTLLGTTIAALFFRWE